MMYPSVSSLIRDLYTDNYRFENLRPEWNGLFIRSPFKSMYLTWEWQTTWWRNGDDGDLHLITWPTPDGDRVGIAPSLRTKADKPVLSFIGCANVDDYLDVIHTQGDESEIDTDLLRFLTTTQAPV